MKQYDVIIIGAGPAGLFAASRLSSHRRVALFEKGLEVGRRFCPAMHHGCVRCQTCDILDGVGGAGLFSDGKLNLDPRIGGNLIPLVGEARAWGYVNEVRTLLERFGPVRDGGQDDYGRLDRLSERLEIIPIPQAHIGSDELSPLIDGLHQWLVNSGVDLRTNSEVVDLRREEGAFLITLKGGEQLRARNVVVATGVAHHHWLLNTLGSLGIKYFHRSIDLGVRVEFDSSDNETCTLQQWDPKIWLRQAGGTYDVRTYCTCRDGFVLVEYHHTVVCCNGYSDANRRSGRTNVAIMAAVPVEEEDPIDYATRVGSSVNAVAKGQVALQPINEFLTRASVPGEIKVTPTYPHAVQANIAGALPERLWRSLTDAMYHMEQFFPSLRERNAICYAPEIKFESLQVSESKNFSTQLEGLYIIGSASGFGRTIVNAAANGLIAADDILASGLSSDGA